MKNLTFIPGITGTFFDAYLKATDAFRLHLEFDRSVRATTTIGVRSTSTGRYDDSWSTTGHTIDKRFSFDGEEAELYVKIHITASPTLAQVDDGVTISNVAQ